MTTRCARWCLLCGVIAAIGCGEPEPEPTPQERCVGDVALYAAGALDASAGAPGAFTFSAGAAAGRFEEGDLYVRLDDAITVGGEVRQVVLRFHTSDGNTELLTRVSRALDDGPVTLEVVDATAQQDTNVTSLDCAFEQGKVCALVAVGANDDGLVTADDLAAFHGARGAITFTELGGLSSRVALEWSLDLGEAILSEDAGAAPSSIGGCLSGRYTQEGMGVWRFE